MIRALVPLGLMHVHELLDAEVSELAGDNAPRMSTHPDLPAGTRNFSELFDNARVERLEVCV